jgi:hypothetical protein
MRNLAVDPSRSGTRHQEPVNERPTTTENRGGLGAPCLGARRLRATAACVPVLTTGRNDNVVTQTTPDGSRRGQSYPENHCMHEASVIAAMNHEFGCPAARVRDWYPKIRI